MRGREGDRFTWLAASRNTVGRTLGLAAPEAYVERVTRMRVAVSRSAPIDQGRAGAGTARSGVRLLAAAAGCLVVAGALMWWRHGDAVFATLVGGALAWCM